MLLNMYYFYVHIKKPLLNRTCSAKIMDVYCPVMSVLHDLDTQYCDQYHGTAHIISSKFRLSQAGSLGISILH